ncbi:Putative deoxyribonuclease YjjV [Thioalkalivibrio nitratireducens DSM 14787]|uniref:Deoxyribonuclease YjjV n=1 Tax=Thioalkalivibrio nitratireducens (strain DSM 14787 / UNIQEM 213 / ALEN2) TaxID=1255043 RepID=L0E3N0_THIND|nr:TatD family hydrolase [Thioalkalivibrio nitratireducens]AGA35276.1 Putative deoxyribonuclease YjjV [Thioalkalivibrio nitratireducens DSM 14787]
MNRVPLPLIDTHVHLDVEAFDADRDATLARARAAGVAALVLPAITRGYWPGLDALANAHTDLFPAYGLHPVFVSTHADHDVEALDRWLDDHPAVAVGEIGLDGFVADIATGATWERQRELFHAQLDVALNHGLPVIIHARRALDQVLKALRVRPGLSGIIHSFSGSRQQADQALGQGFCLGFGGPVTYPRAKRLRRLVAELPETALVLETDAPDQPSVSHRGERNEPAFLPEIADCVAGLRRVSVDEIARLSSANARRILHLPMPAAASA